MLCRCVPDLLAVYAFGSRIQGTARPQSAQCGRVAGAGRLDGRGAGRWPMASSAWSVFAILPCMMDQSLQLPITVDIIQKHLDEFLR